VEDPPAHRYDACRGEHVTDPNALVLRAFETRGDYDQAVTLQRDTWGQDFKECVPASIIQISHKVGGVAAGAFDADGRLVGFVYGLSGLRGGQPAHWSHMLAVYPQYRGSRIGTRLKALQRDMLLAGGIEVAYWTYDPLIAGNAQLNINLLGALPVEYVPDMYGSDTGSDLHSGLGTDRFVVEWRLTDPQVESILQGKAVEHPAADGDAPVIDTDTPDRPHHATPSVRVAIPLDVQSVKQTDPGRALTWRQVTRDALLWHLQNGYRVVGFQRDQPADRGYYYLSTERPTGQRP
jgi:predicted GNAT superfamily acetyltransferase